MKKMMIFAVMMSMMLMPAQMMAKNDRNAKPRVENRVENKKEKKDDKNFMKENKNDKKFNNKNKARKPMPPVAMKPRRPMPKPMSRPRPVPRPIYHNHCCDNDFVETAATIIGLAALVSAIAD